MRFKYTNYLTPIIIILITIIISFSLSACGSRDAEIQVLQQQVEMLATQNALLIESGQDSTSAEVADEVVAPPPPTEDQDVQVEIVEPTPERLPDGPVSAGIPIIYDGWAISVSNNIVIDRGNAFGVTFIVRNLREIDRVFRYQLAGVTITDDQGGTYQPTKDHICEEHMHITKNFSIKGNNSENIYSPSGFRNCHSDHGLQVFSGPISINAKQIFVHLENFGPLSNVSFVIDL